MERFPRRSEKWQAAIDNGRSAVSPASLRIVVPAFNESARIESTLARYCAHFGPTAIVLVVANGCSDDTGRIVRELQRRFQSLHLIEVPSRVGKGGAIRIGLATGREEFVGFVDADGSTEAAEFERLYGIARQSGAQAVIGSRWLSGARVAPRQPLFRRFASRAFNHIVRCLFTLDFKDTQCGAKIFRRRALRSILRELELCDFAADIEILWRLHRTGHTILEIPTVWSDKPLGTKVQIMRASWRMLKSVIYLRLRHSPLGHTPLLGALRGASVMPISVIRQALALGVTGSTRA
jgi:glycosyltransferase involved in cell wall biosynthesis